MSMASAASRNDDKENARAPAAKKKLSAKWMFDAAMLSSPIDLSGLVALSLDNPTAVSDEKGLMQKMVTLVLNSTNEGRRRNVDKRARLDVLKILGHVALTTDAAVKADVRAALDGASDWFDDYVADEGDDVAAAATLHDLGADVDAEPDLHKALLVVLCRAYDYALTTDHLLELCRQDRRLALETVAGLLEDGESLSTAVAQRAAPGSAAGQRAVWEKVLVASRWERSLTAQACELLRGFTQPATYFKTMDDGFYFLECGMELPEHSVDEFSLEMSGLLAVCMHEQLVEKLSFALHEALFEGEARVLTPAEHAAVFAAHEFFQNLYIFGARSVDGQLCAEAYRGHLLTETLLVPHLILPYLERCVYHASVLHRRHAASKSALSMLGDDCAAIVDSVTSRELDDADLTRGIAATLRTLVIATFRAPRTRVMFQILRRFNPTSALLSEMPEFVARHEYIFCLLLQLNVNMGALDISRGAMQASFADACESFEMLRDVSRVFNLLGDAAKRRLRRRLERSGALPVTRDAPSYAALVHLLWGGGMDHFDQLSAALASAAPFEVRGRSDDADSLGETHGDPLGETAAFASSRLAAKEDSAQRCKAAAQQPGKPDILDDFSDILDEFGDEPSEGGVFSLTYNLEDALAAECAPAPAPDDSRDSPLPRHAAERAPLAAEDESKVLRLLGDLPTLDNKKRYKLAPPNKQELEAFLDLDLRVPKANALVDLGYVRSKDGPLSPTSGRQARGVPPRLLCAINGHLMRDPVHGANADGPHYERETIELWLATRGSVCPLTGAKLTKSDLVGDKALQTEILRYQIERKTLRDGAQVDEDDDLYDF